MPASRSMAFLALVAFPLLSISSAAQQYRILHTFDPITGSLPNGDLLQYRGSVAGTTEQGGLSGNGSVITVVDVRTDATFNVIYSFTGGPDGSQPRGGLVVDKVGNLYGTTYAGGAGTCFSDGCGTVFKMSIEDIFGPWTKTVIHNFTGELAGGEDGAAPVGNLTIGPHGDIYGTTSYGGMHGCGIVFKLSDSGGVWSETVLHHFAGTPDGCRPNGRMVFGRHAILYGTTVAGGTFTESEPDGVGTVFQLTPNQDGTWSESVIHDFGAEGDGFAPAAGLHADPEDVLYGTTYYGGIHSCSTSTCGTVFQMKKIQGSWRERVIHHFDGVAGNYPAAVVVRDRSGVFYGTTLSGGAHDTGTVFKLTPSGNDFVHTILHQFGDPTFGQSPNTATALDAFDRIYGMTLLGGTNGVGVLYNINP